MPPAVCWIFRLTGSALPSASAVLLSIKYILENTPLSQVPQDPQPISSEISRNRLRSSAASQWLSP